MNGDVVVDKVNRILHEAGYTRKLDNLADVEGFLGDERNTRLEVYEVIEQLYSELMEDIEL